MGAALDDPPADGADIENSGLTEPLISKQPTSPADDSTDPDEKANFQTWQVALAGLLLVGGLATSAAAMVSAPAVAVYVAGTVCIVNSSSVAVKQYKISKQGDGLIQTINKMNDQVNSLKDEVQCLEDNVDELKEEAKDLKEIQQELDGILDKQGSNANEFLSLLKDNESILKKTRRHMREDALAVITGIVLRSDTDNDMLIERNELDGLTFRVYLALSGRGIDLDQDMFKAMVRKDNDISNVLKVIGAIMFAEDIEVEGERRRIAEYAAEAIQEAKKEIQDSFVPSLAVAGAVGHFQRIAKTASDNKGKVDELEDEEEDDEIPMFLIQEKFHGGSVAVAHGKKLGKLPSLTEKAHHFSMNHSISPRVQDAKTETEGNKRDAFKQRRRDRLKKRGMRMKKAWKGDEE